VETRLCTLSTFPALACSVAYLQCLYIFFACLDIRRNRLIRIREALPECGSYYCRILWRVRPFYKQTEICSPAIHVDAAVCTAAAELTRDVLCVCAVARATCRPASVKPVWNFVICIGYCRETNGARSTYAMSFLTSTTSGTRLQ
jgi:hypothetical protein